MGRWPPSEPGVLQLPSGRSVRGRGLRDGLPAGPQPEFAVYLQAHRPAATPWPSRWVRWRDYWLPSDIDDVRAAVHELHRRADHQRVEVACTGGHGRTGTLLACLAILDEVPAAEAVGYVRLHYDSRAVETPWQRLFVRRFRP